jgi:hypothetical protein
MNMNIKAVTSRPIVQICWVVDDMEAAAMQWIEMFGAGPFFLSHHIEFDELTYRGKRATLDQSSAVCQWGPIQVELFQQHCDSPSGARDMFAPGQTGIQHLTYFSDDIDAETRRLEAMGFPTVMTCSLPVVNGMRLAWFDTRPALGVMIEVYEENELMRQAYDIVDQAAEGWQGEDPLR